MTPLKLTFRPWINLLPVAALLMIAASWGYWKLQDPDTTALPVINLQVSTSSRPAASGFLPEQRRKFALEFGSRFKDRLADATVTTRGDFHRWIEIRSSTIKEPQVLEFKDNGAVIDDLRRMGFTHLIMTDGSTVWDVDLKN